MEDQELIITKLAVNYLVLNAEVKALRADLDKVVLAIKHAGFKLDVMSSSRKPVQEQPDVPAMPAAPASADSMKEIEATLQDLQETGVDLSEEAVRPLPISQRETRNDLGGSWAPPPSQDGQRR